MATNGNNMADDDIVTRLRARPNNQWMLEAADEIEWLRIALALAVGEMSTSGEYSYLSPEVLMNKFLEEARRG